jgi:hypothetical protein
MKPGRKTLNLVGPGGLNQLSIFNGLHLQIIVSVRFEAKGILGALTNLERQRIFIRAYPTHSAY